MAVLISGSLFVSCSDPADKNPFLQTRWELYQYSTPGLNVPLTVTDTLYFDEEPTLVYNGNQLVYRVFRDTGNPGANIRLQMEGTPFGNISGIVQKSMIQSGQIIGSAFGQIGSQGQFDLWLRKIN